MDTPTGYSNSRRLPQVDNPTSYSDLRQPFGDTLPHSDTGIRAATSIAALTPKRKAGRTKFRETRHPVYRGVRRRNGDRWVCEVREPNKKSRIWLGTYPTPEMAARAHDVAVLALRGNSACLNFADSAWLLPTPASASPEDIKKTAAEAAEVFATESDVFPGDLPNVHVEQQGNLSRLPANDFYVDEEAVFGTHMAEGLLMSPLGVSCGDHWDDVETYLELPLWTYSP